MLLNLRMYLSIWGKQCCQLSCQGIFSQVSLLQQKEGEESFFYDTFPLLQMVITDHFIYTLGLAIWHIHVMKQKNAK